MCFGAVGLLHSQGPDVILPSFPSLPSFKAQLKLHFCHNFFLAHSVLTNPTLLWRTYCPHYTCDTSQKLSCSYDILFHEYRGLGLCRGSTPYCVPWASCLTSLSPSVICHLLGFLWDVCRFPTYHMILITHPKNIYWVHTMCIYCAFLMEKLRC